jgi:ketosteroid isomerase-like protein
MPISTPAPPLPPGTPEEIEQQFYQALRRADIEALMALWSDDDDIICVHPGGARVIGPAAVRSSFEVIFANGAIDVQPQRVRRLQSHSCAVHSVLERVQVSAAQGGESGWVVATNVYVHSPLGWRIVAHHASPGLVREPVDGLEHAALLH